MKGRSVLWKRLDSEGADACRYLFDGERWTIEGTALFAEGSEIAELSYRLCCRQDWSSLSASVRGWIGSASVSLDLQGLPDGRWSADGHPLDGLSGLLDIDLGFTPASNTNAIRRLGLQDGLEVGTTALWFDVSDRRLKPLKQSYRRETVTTLAYASPSHGYRALLEVDDFGIVTRYPELWEAVRVTAL